MNQIETSTNQKLGTTKHINKYITIELQHQQQFFQQSDETGQYLEHSNQKFSMGKNLHMERRTNNHKNNTK